jgi:hypothetical protein
LVTPTLGARADMSIDRAGSGNIRAGDDKVGYVANRAGDDTG